MRQQPAECNMVGTFERVYGRRWQQFKSATWEETNSVGCHIFYGQLVKTEDDSVQPGRDSSTDTSSRRDVERRGFNIRFGRRQHSVREASTRGGVYTVKTSPFCLSTF